MKNSKKHKPYPELRINNELRARVRDQLLAYEKMNKIIDKELSRTLPELTPVEARAQFDALCRTWEISFEQNPSMGDLEKQRIQDAIEYRRIFNTIGFLLAKKILAEDECKSTRR